MGNWEKHSYMYKDWMCPKKTMRPEKTIEYCTNYVRDI